MEKQTLQRFLNLNLKQIYLIMKANLTFEFDGEYQIFDFGEPGIYGLGIWVYGSTVVIFAYKDHLIYSLSWLV